MKESNESYHIDETYKIMITWQHLNSSPVIHTDHCN